MPAPFAALESRLDAAVLAHLANAVAVLPGGGEVNVLVESDRESFLDGMASTPGVEVTFPAGAAGLAINVAITIDGLGYRLRRPVDGQPHTWNAVRT